MLKSEIRPDHEYALREKPSASLQRVRVLEHIRGSRWKAEWLDPNPGLVDYVKSGHLLVPWKERKALLRDEAAERQLQEYNRKHGDTGKETPVTRALEVVFENIGDDTICFHRAILSGPSAALERFRARLGKLAPEPSPYGFGDRHGEQHLPLDESLALGRAFCAAEPSAVLIAVETHERDWERQARQPGEVYLVSLLNEYRAAWALIRQWTGQDTAIAQRDAEIQRLERLVLDAIYILQKAKLDSEAARLRRSFGRV